MRRFSWQWAFMLTVAGLLVAAGINLGATHAAPLTPPAAPGGPFTAQTTGVLPAPAAAAPAGGLPTLYDQYNNASTTATSSQQFPDFGVASQTADDFTVPVTQTWQVGEVDVAGAYSQNGGPVSSFNVYFYTSVVSGSYAVPGAAVYTATAQTYTTPTVGSFVIPLALPAVLPGGNYFVSVQAVMNLTPNGQWYWADRTVQTGSPAAWRNPDGAFGRPACANWDNRPFCTGDAPAPDQVFRLAGTVGGAFTPTSTAAPSTATPTATAVPPTSTTTAVPTDTATSVPLATRTSVPPGTATATTTPVNCPLPFTDVDQFNPFYQYIQCLYCRGIISGYSDNTFRWTADVTRGQVAKIVANSAGLNGAVSGQTFTDVPPGNPFYTFIERLVATGAISGYNTAANCPSGIPCFRWELPVTRGQLAKIDANAAGYNENPGLVPAFNDVTVANPFYPYIQRLSLHGVVNGYSCGGPGEPCPGVYYRPNNNITRGQVSKVASQTFFPNACAPAPPPSATATSVASATATVTVVR